MTMYGHGGDIVLECNFCEQEVHRYKDTFLPNGMFYKSHKIICYKCESNVEMKLIEIAKYAKEIRKLSGVKDL